MSNEVKCIHDAERPCIYGLDDEDNAEKKAQADQIIEFLYTDSHTLALSSVLIKRKNAVKIALWEATLSLDRLTKGIVLLPYISNHAVLWILFCIGEGDSISPPVLDISCLEDLIFAVHYLDVKGLGELVYEQVKNLSNEMILENCTCAQLKRINRSILLMKSPKKSHWTLDMQRKWETLSKSWLEAISSDLEEVKFEIEQVRERQLNETMRKEHVSPAVQSLVMQLQKKGEGQVWIPLKSADQVKFQLLEFIQSNPGLSHLENKIDIISSVNFPPRFFPMCCECREELTTGCVLCMCSTLYWMLGNCGCLCCCCERGHRASDGASHYVPCLCFCSPESNAGLNHIAICTHRILCCGNILFEVVPK